MCIYDPDLFQLSLLCHMKMKSDGRLFTHSSASPIEFGSGVMEGSIDDLWSSIAEPQYMQEPNPTEPAFRSKSGFSESKWFFKIRLEQFQISWKHFWKQKNGKLQKPIHIEDIQVLVTEIEMLKVVLYLVRRREHGRSSLAMTLYSVR